MEFLDHRDELIHPVCIGTDHDGDQLLEEIAVQGGELVGKLGGNFAVQGRQELGDAILGLGQQVVAGLGVLGSEVLPSLVRPRAPGV